MKRIIVLTTLLLALIALLCLPAYATESNPADIPAASEGVTPSDPADTTEPPASDGAVTQSIAEWLTEHFSDIVSAATGVGLIVLTWAFKKGLVPFVTKTIQQVAQRSEAAEGKFDAGTKSAVSLLETCGERLEKCSEALDAANKKMQKKIAAQNKAYELQTDLINYLVMNLRIPNDLKAEVAERSAAVKSAIEEAGKAE